MRIIRSKSSTSFLLASNVNSPPCNTHLRFVAAMKKWGNMRSAIDTKRVALLLCSSVANTGLYAQITADTNAGLEEIIVTAERREADIQRIAASVTVKNGNDLAGQGRYTLNQILEGIPGVSGSEFSGIGGTGSSTPELSVSIRGIRSNESTNNLPTVPATAMYVDGVYGGIGRNYDIERVEVLRGPQGTLYGRSATGGVIAIYTKNPNLIQLEGHASLEAGSYSLRHYTGGVNLPVVNDKLAVRISGNHFERDGYDHPRGGAMKNEDARIKLLYQPLNDLSLLLGFAWQENETHSGGITYRLTGERRPGAYYADYSTPVGDGKNSTKQYWAELQWDFGSMTLTYMPAFRTWENDGLNVNVGPGGDILNQHVTTPADEYLTHEIHLASQSDTRLTWLLGALYWSNHTVGFTNDTRWRVNNALLIYRVQDRDAKDAGVFGEATYAITDSTRLTAGIRYDKSSVETVMDYRANLNRLANPGTPNVGQPENVQVYPIGGDEGKEDYTNFTYKLRLEHDLSSNHLLYAMVSTGFLPGDIQIGSSVPLASYKYKAETLTAYEIGTKNRFLDERLQANASFYFYKYGGYQTSVTPNSADPTSSFFTSIPAEIKGFDLELLYQLTPRDRLGFTYGYIDPYWVDAPAAFTAAVAQPEITGIPPVTATLSYDRRLDLPGGSSLNLHADARYQAAYDTTTVTPQRVTLGIGPYVRLDDQVLGNVSATWTSTAGKYTIGGYVRNVADHRFRTANSIQTFTATALSGTISLSEPRTWGVTAGVNF